MAKRFSRARLIEDLRKMTESRKGNFDANNGWPQVQGKGEAINRDYAEWRAVQMIYLLVARGEIGQGKAGSKHG